MDENIKLENCDNRYSVNELYDKFGIDDHEVKVCMQCVNCITEGGILTCKYIINRCDMEDNCHGN